MASPARKTGFFSGGLGRPKLLGVYGTCTTVVRGKYPMWRSMAGMTPLASKGYGGLKKLEASVMLLWRCARGGSRSRNSGATAMQIICVTATPFPCFTVRDTRLCS